MSGVLSVRLRTDALAALDENCGLGSQWCDCHSPTELRPMSEVPAKGVSCEGDGPPRQTLRSPRVLIVDDVVDAAVGMARLLKMLECEVQIASDGPAALAIASQFVPDVVLLDIGLPGLDGHEVARRLRADAATSKAWIVALSGYGHEAARQQSLDAGCNQHFTKPIRMEALEGLLAPRRRPLSAD